MKFRSLEKSITMRCGMPYSLYDDDDDDVDVEFSLREIECA